MARYWVGGSGNWDASDTTHWSATDGGAGGASVPSAADDVFFTSNSGTGTCTLTANRPCRSVQSGSTSLLTFVHNSNCNITVGDATAGFGNIAVDLSGFTTYTVAAVTSQWTFISTSSTNQTIDFGGHTTGHVTYFAASNGVWTYSNHHTTASAATVTFTRGALDTDDFTMTWGAFNSNNANTRTLTLRGSPINILAGGFTAWNTNTVTGFTLTANTATITMSGAGVSFSGGAGKSYGGSLIFTGSGVATFTDGTFENVTRTGTAVKTDTFQIAANATIAGTLTLTANSDINRLLVHSNVVGTARTLTVGTLVTSGVIDFRDITGAGTATWTIASGATYFGDCGGNSGITMTTPATQTATGTASFTWSTHGWTSRVPLPQDDVIINNAFIAGRTITMDMPRPGKNIDFTGMTGSPTATVSVNTDIHGSLTLISAMTWTASSAVTFVGRGNHTITSAGKSFAAQVAITAFGGTYTLQDALSVPNSLFVISNGTFDANDFNVTFGTFSIVGSGVTKTVHMGNGTWGIRSTASGTPFSIGFASGLTWNPEGSTVEFLTTTANPRTIATAGVSFNIIKYTLSGSTGGLNFSGNPSIYELQFSDASNARTLQITAATTITFTGPNGIVGNGASGRLLTLTSVSAANHNIVMASGTINIDWWNISRSQASGGASFFAGANSVDGGNNSGWQFIAAPTTLIKNIIGIAQASVKKVDNVVIASVKKVVGVSNV